MKKGRKNTAGSTSLLWRAVESGSKDAVKKALGHCSVNSVDEEGQTALHVACQDENVEIVKFLLSRKANVNAQDVNGWTPLHCAAKGCHLRTLSLILQERSCDVNLLTSDATSALSYLVRQSFVKVKREMPLYLHILNHMVEKGADVNLVNRTGEAPIHSAALSGNVESIRFLLGAGARVNIETLRGETALHRAVQLGKTATVHVLLEYGADPYHANHDGVAPMQLAIEGKHTELIALMTARAKSLGVLLEDCRHHGGVEVLNQKSSVWEQRHLTVNDAFLTVFGSGDDSAKMCSFFDLKKCQSKVHEAEEGYQFQVIKPGRTETFKVDTLEAAEKWVAVLNDKSHARKIVAESLSSTSENPDLSHSDTSDLRVQLQSFLEIPGNQRCCECGRCPPDYVATELGIFVCFRCAEFMAELEISPTKSIHMDDISLSEVLTLKMNGNVKVNQKLEASIPLSVFRPTSRSSREERAAFLRAKYLEKRFVASEHLSAEQASLKRTIAKRIRFFASENDANLREVLRDLCVESLAQIMESPLYRAIHAQLSAPFTPDSGEDMPDDTILRVLESSDSSAVGVNAGFYGPMIGLAFLVCDALTKKTASNPQLRRKYIDAFTLHYSKLETLAMVDAHVESILRWWFPQCLQLLGVCDCQGEIEIPSEPFVVPFRSNTATALYLLSGDYMVQKTTKFSSYDWSDVDFSKPKSRQAAMKQLKEKSRQHTEQLRKILHNLRKHYNAAFEPRSDGSVMFGSSSNMLQRTHSTLSNSSMGFTTSLWSSPATSPRQSNDRMGTLAKLCYSQSNLLGNVLLAIIGELSDSVCRSLLKLEKTAHTVGVIHDEEPMAQTLFGNEGEGFSHHIHMLQEAIKRLRMLYEFSRSTDATRSRYNRRQILIALMTLESLALQHVPFAAPEMWTSWHSLNDLLEELLAYVLQCERAAHRGDMLELQGTMLVQLRWTVSKLVELQALEDAHLSF